LQIHGIIPTPVIAGIKKKKQKNDGIIMICFPEVILNTEYFQFAQVSEISPLHNMTCCGY